MYANLPEPAPNPALLAHLRAQQATLPLFQDVPDFEHIEAVAAKFRQFQQVIILGTGGSSLAGQTLTALSSQGPRLIFCDNIDPHTFEQLKINPETTGLLIISKSGNTAETLMQSLYLVPQFKGVEDHVHVITQPGTSALQALAAHWKLPVTPHPTGIGGRYSAFTVVGLLPAAIVGLDIRAVWEGAQGALSSPMIAAMQAVEAPQTISVLMTYCDRLTYFGQWYRQLWAESLGKEGKGTTPVPAQGAVDQHSQLQLYLDGPNDKLYTVILLADDGRGPPAPAVPVEHPALATLMGRRLGELFAAEGEATLATLEQAGRPVRVIRVSELTETTLGELIMQFFLETLSAAFLLKINPFDQPAVESGKILAEKYLKITAA